MRRPSLRSHARALRCELFCTPLATDSSPLPSAGADFAHVEVDRPLAESLHEWFLNSAHRTADPEQADYFFMPMGIRIMGPERAAQAFEYIVREFPYYNRSRGADHLLAVTDDAGLSGVVESTATARPEVR